MKKKTYVIHASEYGFRGVEPSMRSFRGTWRALLMHLHTQHYLDELEPEEKDEYDAMSDEQLLESFEQSNGDGQPFYMVWCVEDDELVIGAERG